MIFYTCQLTKFFKAGVTLLLATRPCLVSGLFFPFLAAGWNLMKNWTNEERWKHGFMLMCISGGLLTTVNRATFFAIGLTLLFALITKYWEKYLL